LATIQLEGTPEDQMKPEVQHQLEEADIQAELKQLKTDLKALSSAHEKDRGRLSKAESDAMRKYGFTGKTANKSNDSMDAWLQEKIDQIMARIEQLGG
jgi:hypothetical protein